MSNQMNGAKLIVDCLARHGVKYIFGIPGERVDAILMALHNSPIKLIMCRHEQNAAFMAAAYGRLTGKPGVVLVTSDVGISNLATALASATTEGDPIVALGSNLKSKDFHQSTDLIKLIEAVTKVRMDLMAPENISEVIENAFRLASAPRSGAVFVNLPRDVLNEITDLKANMPVPITLPGYAPEAIIEKTAKLIDQAKVPLLLLGLEARRPESTVAIRQFLKAYPIAVLGTQQATGVVSRDLSQFNMGNVGIFKDQPGDKLLEIADLVITVGFSPNEYDPEHWNSLRTKQIIHIDYNPANIHSHYLPVVEMLGDISLNLEKLSPQLKPKTEFEHEERINHFQKTLEDNIAHATEKQGHLIHPLRFIHDLQKIMNDEITVISDIGVHHLWLARYFFSYQPHHLICNNNQQILGTALPWAIATHFARPGGKVISISSKSGFLFSAMELETAVREKTSFVHCVWVDGSEKNGKAHPAISAKTPAVDMVKFAESFGIHCFRIQHANEFAGILEQALNLNAPVVIEIPIDYSDNQAFLTMRHAQMES